MAFLISVLTLSLELLQTRMLSVQYWHHLVYFVITMALMGMAVGGTVLSISSRIRSLEEKSFYHFCLIGFCVSALFGTYIITITNLPTGVSSFWEYTAGVLGFLVVHTVAMIPYFFFGLLISGMLQRNPEQSGIIYFANLLGSAAGCLLYISLIRALGAINLLVFLFLLGVIPGLCILKTARFTYKVVTILSIAIIAYLGATSIHVVPDRNKQYWTMFKDRQVEFSQWNAISRVDVVSEKGVVDYKRILYDGDAQTPLVKVDLQHLAQDSLPALPKNPWRELVYDLFKQRKLDRVLVIGSGGGSDVLAAYKRGAHKIDAVEINPTTVDIVSNRFSPFIGNIFKSPKVKLYLEDGRSFTRRSDEQYDVVVINWVDSFAALSSGAYILSENYLYTLEAFQDYWHHLSDEGVINIIRWYYPVKPRETLRVFTTAYTALRLSGVADPLQHLLVVGNEKDPGAPVAAMIISRKPISEIETLRACDWNSKHGSHLIFSLSPGGNFLLGSKDFVHFASLESVEGEKDFYEDYPFNVFPTTDDNPFFFQYGKWSKLFTPSDRDVAYYSFIRGKKPYIILLAVVGQSIIFVILLVWLPLWRLEQKVTKLTNHIPIVLYFSSLGIAFMFIEMPLIQQFTLFLGHPIYSMAVTIPTLLIAAGMGSFYSNQLEIKTPRTLAFPVLAICALIIVWLLAAPTITKALLPYSITIRIAITIALIFPIGFLMGIPFPIGIRRLADFPQMIPIVWAANGGMSVIASIIAIILGMMWGFSVVLSIGAATYLCALACFRAYVNKSAAEGPASLSPKGLNNGPIDSVYERLQGLNLFTLKKHYILILAVVVSLTGLFLLLAGVSKRGRFFSPEQHSRIASKPAILIRFLAENTSNGNVILTDIEPDSIGRVMSQSLLQECLPGREIKLIKDVNGLHKALASDNKVLEKTPNKHQEIRDYYVLLEKGKSGRDLIQFASQGATDLTILDVQEWYNTHFGTTPPQDAETQFTLYKVNILPELK